MRLDFSAAERFALVGGAVCLGLQAFGWAEALEYRRSLLTSEPWRWLSGHAVHLGWLHAIVNVAAWWIVARLFAPDLGARQQALALVLAALAVSLTLAVLYPSIDWYRGLSGALHGLYFAGATAWLVNARPRTVERIWLPLGLVIGGWIKVWMEQPGGSSTPYADWLQAAVVPQAHLAGAVCGTIVGLVAATFDAHGREEPEQR